LYALRARNADANARALYACAKCAPQRIAVSTPVVSLCVME
jgi:hypothetical protein